jgi:prepilin-type N-terminal cleavage/methylation domain-containing protein
MRRTPTARRSAAAYTLVEMIVVLAIIAFLAGLVIVLWPGFAASTQTTMNADKVQGMLLNARMMAMRDRTPTGVRLIPADPNNPFGPVKQLVYIQQPPPYTAPVLPGPSGTTLVGTLAAVPSPGGTTLTFSNLDFSGGLAGSTNANDWPVQPGDYLEIYGGGSLHKIIQVGQQQLAIEDTVVVPTATTNFRVNRQPRVVVGEEPVELTGDIIIDLGSSQTPPILTLSPNVPLRAAKPSNGTTSIFYREIIFSPSGTVIGKVTSSADKVILWVRDGSRQSVFDGEPVLIAVQIGTGMVGAYPVDASSGDPFSNTRDPHASGL